MKRSQAISLGVSASALVATSLRSDAVAHNLPPKSFDAPAYNASLEAGGTKAVFQSPNVEASVKQGDYLTHLLPLQVKNWLNAFQFSYLIKPEDLHVVVATYASANLLTYGDVTWSKYKLGEKYKVTDPKTGLPAVRNLFLASRSASDAPHNPDDPKSFYQDVGIETLQKRGVVFLT